MVMEAILKGIADRVETTKAEFPDAEVQEVIDALNKTYAAWLSKHHVLLWLFMEHHAV